MTEPLISLTGIKKVFYTDEVETHALSDIHLEIQRGEYLAIAGPSGCGKTTLLSILGLLDSPTDGTYVLANLPIGPYAIEAALPDLLKLCRVIHQCGQQLRQPGGVRRACLPTSRALPASRAPSGTRFSRPASAGST